MFIVVSKNNNKFLAIQDGIAIATGHSTDWNPSSLRWQVEQFVRNGYVPRDYEFRGEIHSVVVDDLPQELLQTTIDRTFSNTYLPTVFLKKGQVYGISSTKFININEYTNNMQYDSTYLDVWVGEDNKPYIEIVQDFSDSLTIIFGNAIKVQVVQVWKK